ncbi:hypothetical protein L6452_18530 [Arctium lappa]|uniref:Uncharacterized protein n=1 Tax=Arctium lappa TaxID=4217 RepID=A0ACB9C6G0_ARCLA|nr:hypothetical protein L6452_18530 [Arctium lappa]
MANTVNYFSAGSQSKPPTLLRDEYPQWKIRMVHFLEGVDPGLVEFLHNPPFIPMTTVPRVPATANTSEIPEYQHPKPVLEWSEEEKAQHELAKKAKRLIIMAIPNDIFQSLESCETSKDLWLELEKQLEGGAKTLKNNRALCINEYFAFKALPGESIQSTYNRYNSLINKCKRYGIHRTSEENNVRFLQSLNDEWLHLTMSMQATLDLDVWSISDLFGTLISQENRISKLSTSVGGPLALVGCASEGKDKGKKDKATEEAQKKKKKKVLVAESESEEDSEEEIDTSALAKTLALMTRQFNRGLKKKPEYKGREERDDRSRGYGEAKRKEWSEEPRQEERNGQKSDGRAGDKFPKQTEGCFKCGKPGHYAAECRSSANTGKPTRDAAFYKKKAEYYTQKSLMAEQENLVTDESSDEENNALFCGMAEVHSSDNESEVSTFNSCNSDFESKLLEIQNDLLAYKHTCSDLEKKLAFFERETRLLTEEKDKLYFQNKTLISEHISTKRDFNDKITNLDRALKEKEREALHRDLFDKNLKIKRYQDAQKVTEKVNTQIGRRGIGFDDIDPYTGDKRNKSLANIFCVGKSLNPSLPNLLSTFKRRKTSEEPHLRNPLLMVDTWYENNNLPSSFLSKRNYIPKKYLPQKQIGIFRFGHPETQTQMAFVCMMTPEKELSSEAPEFVPASVEEKLFKRFLENDLRKTYENHFLNHPDIISDVREIFEQDLQNCLNIPMVIPCISKILNTSEDTNGQSKALVEGQDFIHRDFLDSDSESESEFSVGNETSSVELKILPCGPEKSKLTSGILNRTVLPKRKTTGVSICPDFLDMCLQAKTSLELERSKRNKIPHDSKAPRPLKPFQEKLTWQQKNKWPKIDKLDASVAVKARKEDQGRVQPKSHSRRVFEKTQPRLDKAFCKRKPKSKMGCSKICSVPSFDKLNEIFKKFASNVPYCKCFDLMHSLNQHFSKPTCLISHPKPKNAKFKGEKRQTGTSANKDKSKTKDVKASSKSTNRNGPIWKWVPKTL